MEGIFIKSFDFIGLAGEVMLQANSPLYLQVAEVLRAKIARLEYEAGHKLPEVAYIAYKLQTNPRIVDRALQVLEEEGLVVSDPEGTRYITMAHSRLMQVRELMLDKELREVIKRAKSYEFDLQDLQDKIAQLWGEL